MDLEMKEIFIEKKLKELNAPKEFFFKCYQSVEVVCKVFDILRKPNPTLDMIYDALLIESKEEVKNLTAEQKAHTNLEIEGSLKDAAGLSIFQRRSSGDFKIFGNYYTIDSEKIK